MEGPEKFWQKTLEDNLWGHWWLIHQTIGCLVYKIVSIKFKQEFNVSHSIPVGLRKSIQIIYFKYGFSQVVKIKRKIIG